MGPVINKAQYDKVPAYIEQGKKDGRLMARGGPAEQFEKGLLIQPTALADIANDSVLAQEEIFGPVLVLVPCGEATRTRSGSSTNPVRAVRRRLSAHDARAHAVAQQLRTGSVSVNSGVWFDPGSPSRTTSRAVWGVSGARRASRTSSRPRRIGVPA